MESEPEIIDYDTAVDEKYRVYASLSFAVLLLGIGIPLWWHTTAVQRVPLPYSGIDQLASLEIKIQTKVIVAARSKERGKALVSEINSTFSNTEIYQLNIVQRTISSNLWVLAFTEYEHEQIAASFNLKPGDILLLETPHLDDEVLAGFKRTIYFSTATNADKLIQVLSEWILRDASLALTKNALTEPTLYSLDEENRRRFPASPAYDILITAVNPDPDSLRIDWDLRALAKDYMQPFLDELSVLSSFSVKSQWLYLLPLEMSPTRIPNSGPLGRHFALPESVLPQLVTPLEKKLASQVSLNPTINFVVYAVPCKSGPIHIYTRTGQRPDVNTNVEAFLSPRWGGVVLINPTTEACVNATDDEPVSIMPEETIAVGTFLAQLRLLLGIPEPKTIAGAVSRMGPKPCDWEVDALLRIRSVEQLTSAKLTLQSLAQLLKEISNIVITDVVGNRIKSALHLVEASAEELSQGNLVSGFSLSKEAFVTAEAAFSDPTLLALLYFPEDQKYAVYIPLFLPAMIPVLLSLKNIHRYYFPEKKKKKKKATATDQKNEPVPEEEEEKSAQ